ncbi:hypothetical protein [Candidatus Electrothrix sp.]|uniref:hypothetical protein n=1 Tax=Candidatus Electrothrix sp. TaxID=2170559 RepID=UPI004056848A
MDFGDHDQLGYSVYNRLLDVGCSKKAGCPLCALLFVVLPAGVIDGVVKPKCDCNLRWMGCLDGGEVVTGSDSQQYIYPCDNDGPVQYRLV